MVRWLIAFERCAIEFYLCSLGANFLNSADRQTRLPTALP